MSSSSSSSSKEEEYVVEAILADKWDNGEHLYLIKWENYDSSSNTWEPKANLNCPDLLKAYNDKVKKKKDDRSAKKQLSRKSVKQPKLMSKSLTELPSERREIIKKRKSTESFQHAYQSEENEPTSSTSFANDDESLLYSSKSIKSLSVSDKPDEILHDIVPSDFGNYDDGEVYNLNDESCSDEYVSDEEENCNRDYTKSFMFPQFSKPIKVINLCSINNERFFMILFDDNRIYYVEENNANNQCKELVLRYQKSRRIDDKTSFRNF